MNVIQNAVEHTKKMESFILTQRSRDGRLTFIVEDSGSGFTKEALLYGTEQFLWMTQVEMAKPLWDGTIFCKNCG